MNDVLECKIYARFGIYVDVAGRTFDCLFQDSSFFEQNLDILTWQTVWPHGSLQRLRKVLQRKKL